MPVCPTRLPQCRTAERNTWSRSSDFSRPAYRFVDNGYIVLDLDDETELGSGRVQELPDGVESVLRRAMAQGIGVTILDEHEQLEELGSIAALTRY